MREQPQRIILLLRVECILKVVHLFVYRKGKFEITLINVILLFFGSKKFVNSSVNNKINGRICNYLLFKSGKIA